MDIDTGQLQGQPVLGQNGQKIGTSENVFLERPVVAKETVPVERVRLDRQTVTEEAQVGETVGKEKIDTDGVEDHRRD